MRLISIIAIISLLISCNNKDVNKTEHTNKNNFKIEGHLSQFPDDTQVGLFMNKKIVDSTFLKNGKFTFEKEFTGITDANIFLKNTSFFVNFWVEKGLIIIKNDSKNALNTKITGGKVQTDENKLIKQITNIRKEQDSISLLIDTKKIFDKQEADAKELIRKSQEREHEMYIVFFKETPNSLASMRLLDAFKTFWDKNTIEEIYNLTTDNEVKNSAYGKNVANYLQVSGNPKKGDSFIDFTQTDSNGKSLKFSEIQKEFTLINFWASWCNECRKLNLKLKDTYKKYNSEGFEIVNVSIDLNDVAWKKAIEQDELTWPQVSNLNGWNNPIVYMYGVTGVPANFLIDKDGIIIEKTITPERLNEILKSVEK